MTISPTTSSSIEIPFSEQKNIDKLKAIISQNERKGTDSALQHAVLGALYARYSKNEEAFTHLGKAIELDPENPKIGLAYSRRGQLYRIMGLRDKAFDDFTKAKEILPAEHSDRISIENELNLLQKEDEGSAKTEQKIALPHMQSGFKGSTFGCGENRMGADMVNYFAAVLDFLDGEEANVPTIGSHERDKLYWNAFSLCRKALGYESEHGLDENCRSLFLSAKEHLIQLKACHKTIPSMILYLSAVVNFKLENYEDAHAEISQAIEKSPSDSKFYEFRKLVRLELGFEELASHDDLCVRELNQPSKHLDELNSALLELNKLITFYDQAKTDKNTYLHVIREFRGRNMVNVTEPALKKLTVEEMLDHFTRNGITLTPPPKSIHDPISQSVYNALAEIGIAMEPRRGEGLPSIEVLYLRRAMILSTLAKLTGNVDKLKASLEDTDRVIQFTDGSNPELCARAYIGRALVSQSYKEYEDALADLNLAKTLVPDHQDIQKEIEGIIKNMPN